VTRQCTPREWLLPLWAMHIIRRAVCSLDVAEAVPAFGGYGAVAERMCWAMPLKRRRKRGYWARYENIQAELDLLAEEQGSEKGLIPSKSSLRALGRYDIAKAIEKKGGFTAVCSRHICSQ
jgi:hypothetical protein